MPRRAARVGAERGYAPERIAPVLVAGWVLALCSILAAASAPPAWHLVSGGAAGAAGLLASFRLHTGARDRAARADGSPSGAAPSDAPATPWHEALAAVAGPAVSLVLAAAFAFATLAAEVLTLPVAVPALTAALGWANLVFAVVHVLPCPFLGGGRLLRAVLWRVGGDRARADRGVARAARGVGLAFACVGLLVALCGNELAGIAAVGLGAFLRGTARSRAAGTSARAE